MEPAPPHVPPPAARHAAPHAGSRRHYLLLVAGDGVAKLLGLITFGVLGRRLGNSAYGSVEFVAALVFVATLVVDAGLGPMAARAVAQDPSAARRLRGAVMLLRAGLLLVALLGLGVIAYGTDAGAQARAVIFSYAVVLLPMPFIADWLFQGRDEMGIVTLGQVLRQGVFALAAPLVVASAADAARAPLAEACGAAALAALHLFVARRRAGPIAWDGALGAARALLRKAVAGALSTLMWAVRFFAPLILLGFVNEPQVATFAPAHRLIVAAHAAVFLWFFNLLPTWARAAHGHSVVGLAAAVRRSRANTLALAVALAAGVAVAAPIVVPLVWGTAYESSVQIAQVLAPVLFLACVSGMWRFAFLAAGRPRHDLIANGAGAIAGVVALVFCARGGLTALTAAVCFVVSEAVTLAVAWIRWRMLLTQTHGGGGAKAA